MDTFLPELDGFINMHASRIAHHKGARVAYLAEYRDPLSMDCNIKPYSMKMIVDEFGTDAPLVRWVLKQIQTHDIEHEKVLGLIFGKSEIVCQVVKIQQK